MIRIAFLAALVAVSADSSASAQTNTTAPVPAASDAWRAKDILGATVSLSGIASVGKVDDFVIDSRGSIEYLIVDNGGKLTTVPWDAAKFDVAKRTATLTITKDVYATIPTYTLTTYPAWFTPAYRTEIYKYYGLTPRQERRIDRIEGRKP